jgi:hypothetical protein
MPLGLAAHHLAAGDLGARTKPSHQIIIAADVVGSGFEPDAEKLAQTSHFTHESSHPAPQSFTRTERWRCLWIFVFGPPRQLGRSR